jgi:hypothetical protein
MDLRYASAAGEMLGFAFGAGNTSAKLCDFEFRRERHLSKARRSRV